MLKLFGLEIHLYGLTLGLGALAGLNVAQRLAKKRNLPEKLVEEGFWWALVLGLIGARIYHVIDLWDELYRFNPLNSLYLWQGGLGIFGGIAGGVLGILLFWLLRARKNISLLSLLDLGAFGLPLAQAIGRFGNFFNRELAGKVTNLPWAITSTDGTKVHPLFLYESLLTLVLFLILVKLVKGKSVNTRVILVGQIFALYLVGYGLIRFLLEPLRPPEIIWMVLGIPVAQLAAGVAIAVGFVLWLRLKKVGRDL